MDKPKQSARGNAIVVVMGDVGRSSRMCYHALSLANHGLNVQMVGYEGSKPHEKIATHAHIKLVPVKQFPKEVSGSYPKLIDLFIKFVWMFAMTFYTLFFCAPPKASLLIMQNPPGLPTMLICYLAAKWKGAVFVIDWHNYTHSMLDLPKALNEGGNISSSNFLSKRAIQLVASMEGILGGRAQWNLCVSRAMRKDLKKRWSIKALTLYDKVPAWIFRPLSLEEQHNFLHKLMATEQFSALDLDWSSHTTNKLPEVKSEVSMFSYKDSAGQVQFLPSRPLLLVSSTSWTEDEDFGMLLDALVDYDNQAQVSNILSSDENKVEVLPKVLMIISGKGPQKERYQTRIDSLKLSYVRIVTIWLPAEEYPKLLACANLGISMHISSSGLDLPMKIVDMFGCNVPVLAKRFKAIGEQVVDGSNGILFDSSFDLKTKLVKLSTGFPLHCDDLNKLKKSLKNDYSRTTWEKQWDTIFWPLIQSLLPPELYDESLMEPLKTADETIDEIAEEMRTELKQ